MRFARMLSRPQDVPLVTLQYDRNVVFQSLHMELSSLP